MYPRDVNATTRHEGNTRRAFRVSISFSFIWFHLASFLWSIQDERVMLLYFSILTHILLNHFRM